MLPSPLRSCGATPDKPLISDRLTSIDGRFGAGIHTPSLPALLAAVAGGLVREDRGAEEHRGQAGQRFFPCVP